MTRQQEPRRGSDPAERGWVLPPPPQHKAKGQSFQQMVLEQQGGQGPPEEARFTPRAIFNDDPRMNVAPRVKPQSIEPRPEKQAKSPRDLVRGRVLEVTADVRSIKEELDLINIEGSCFSDSIDARKTN